MQKLSNVPFKKLATKKGSTSYCVHVNALDWIGYSTYG